jgi:hypothetical protein
MITRTYSLPAISCEQSQLVEGADSSWPFAKTC